MYGRYPVINAANLIFILATIMAVTSQSVPVFVAARAMTGLAVASNVLNPAIVGDMFVSEERGGAVSLIFLAPLIGGALGPAIASAVAEGYGWRAVLWMSVGMASVCEVVFLTCFRETYKVAILRKRAERLGAEGKKGVVEGGEQEDGWRGLRDAVFRPARVLFGSGVLMAMSAFGSVVFSYYYVLSTTLAEILREIYELDPITVGFCFISFSKFSLWIRGGDTDTNGHSRHRIGFQRLDLQPPPRQDLHQDEGRQQRPGPPGVPTALGHCWRLLDAYRHRVLRLERRAPTRRAVHASLRRVDGRISDSCSGPHDRIHR